MSRQSQPQEDRPDDSNWTPEAKAEYELYLAEMDLPPYKRKDWLEEQVCAAEFNEER